MKKETFSNIVTMLKSDDSEIAVLGLSLLLSNPEFKEFCMMRGILTSYYSFFYRPVINKVEFIDSTRFILSDEYYPIPRINLSLNNIFNLMQKFWVYGRGELETD